MFYSGDYEFLTRTYGLSGASGKQHTVHIHYKLLITFNIHLSGRHCCLWCHIKGSDLKTPPSVRGPVVLRSLSTMATDLQRFEQSGKSIKYVKEFNNVLYQNFFNIPLDQVRK